MIVWFVILSIKAVDTGRWLLDNSFNQRTPEPLNLFNLIVSVEQNSGNSTIFVKLRKVFE